MVEFNSELFKKAYKKLKSSIYYDKTQLILRSKIVEFESTQENIDTYISNLYERFKSSDEDHPLSDDMANRIRYHAFPKSFTEKKRDIITNTSPGSCPIDKLQYFIDMPVELHILSVVWLLTIGHEIDKDIYEHSYGNRMRENLINNDTGQPTFSPYLFEPYFEQYESWRDTAMAEAQKHLGLCQDVVIVTMDFERFFYSVNVDEKAFKAILNQFNSKKECTKEESTHIKKINNLMFKIVEKYSQLFDDKFGNRYILPIGFLPSNVISNWCLSNFDDTIINGWNPIYYGRYVDDIIIVDKVEKNSKIYKMAQNDELQNEDIVNLFLKQCSRWFGIDKNSSYCESEFSVIIDAKKDEDNEEKCKYQVNPKYNPLTNDESKIIVQNDKVKIFYFNSGESDALITCFREEVAKNKSEFRHMPEDESFFQHDNYNEIYTLKNNDTINKLRGVDGISIDKFELSKFLGKHLRIGGLIDDKIESRFEKDVLKIFNSHVIIENYIMWEKIFEIFVINEKFESAITFAKKIYHSIDAANISEKCMKTPVNLVKETLILYLCSAMLRSFSLVKSKASSKVLAEIYVYIVNKDTSFKERLSDSIGTYLYPEEKEETLKKIPDYLDKYINDYLDKYTNDYRITRMVDKSVMPILFDMLNFNSPENDGDVNLTKFYQELKLADGKLEADYKYYPYMVTMYDCSMISCIQEIKEVGKDNSTPFKDLESITNEQIAMYAKLNYVCDDIANYNIPIKVSNLNEKNEELHRYKVRVGSSKKEKLKIAIANVKLDPANFEKIVEDNPNRSYRRYRDLSTIVNQAIDQDADMLVMPESFMPYEWLSTLARTCARNKLAVVTGIEHIKYNGYIFNLTATILPYKEGKHNCAFITFHLKTHYAPKEQQQIIGYGLKEVRGSNYELYVWNDCHFPVYWCYELSSIKDRSLFMSCADMLVAVEWNKDINYYSNILESLSRDIHCYCVQVNSSNYGDSRITKPSKTEVKDIIRTKGGSNSTVLVDEIDIKTLRDFQIKGYNLQQHDNRFKPTPPNFDKKLVMEKIKGTLK